MQLIVGHEQLQFVFVDSKTAPQKVVGVYPEFVGGRIRIRAAGLFLKHMTMGVKAITSRRDPSQYRYWEMADFTSDGLAADKVYRLYARVPVSGESGTFVLHDTFKGMNDEAGFYLLLMGYLGAEREGNRSWGRAYGFTEILPGQITTELIQDPNAQLVIDLANGRITGPLTITAGSVGYNNLTDKPDLTGYLTKSEFKVTADQIRAEVGRANQTAGGTKAQLDAFQQQTQQNVNNLLNRQAAADGKIYQLQTAGYITTAQGNALYASAQLANGKTIASYITQSPEAINMISRNININAAVTFESYKEDNAQKLAAVNRRVSNTETTLSNQQNQLNQKQGKYDPFDINNARLNGKTVIEGGYINTSLINTDNLKVKNVAQVGGFNIEGNTLIAKGFNNVWSTNQAVRIDPFGGVVVKNGVNSETQLSASGLTTTVYGGTTAIEGSTFRLNRQANTFEVIIARIPGSPDWHDYLQFKTKGLPHKNHIAAMPDGHDFKRVVVDINTGLMGWE